MSFAIYKGEKNISELVSRLFRLQGKGSQAANKQAADALLKANPQLKDFSKLALGSVITMPETAPLLHPAARADRFVLMRSAAVQRARQAMGVGDSQLTEVRAVDATKSFLELSKSRELQAAAANNPDLKKGLAEIITTAEQMLKDLQTAPAARKDQIAELDNHLATLLEP